MRGVRWLVADGSCGRCVSPGCRRDGREHTPAKRPVRLRSRRPATRSGILSAVRPQPAPAFSAVHPFLISFLFLLLFLLPPQSYCCAQTYRCKNLSFTRNNGKVREAFVSLTGIQEQGFSSRASSQFLNPLLRNGSRFRQHVVFWRTLNTGLSIFNQEQGKDCTRTRKWPCFRKPGNLNDGMGTLRKRIQSGEPISRGDRPSPGTFASVHAA